MQKRVFLLTGVPGVGKTTALSKTIAALKARGFAVGGMISQEVRESNVRVGFEITDLASGKHGRLASINQRIGPQVGKYYVNLQDLGNVGAKAIEEATKKCAVVVIDEIGPMELFSQRFKQAVKQALDSEKVVLAIVHGKAKDPLIDMVVRREDAGIFSVTLANRDSLPETLRKDAQLFLES